MRDGEGKVLTADDEFLNTLSARQALCRHRRWSHRQYSAPTLVPTSRRNYFDDVDIPDVVSGTDLLPLPATDLHCIDMYRRHQADRSTTMPNALRGMYLLITALRGMWRRSNWHHLQGMKHILQIVFCWPLSWSIYYVHIYRIIHEVCILVHNRIYESLLVCCMPPDQESMSLHVWPVRNDSILCSKIVLDPHAQAQLHVVIRIHLQHGSYGSYSAWSRCHTPMPQLHGLHAISGLIVVDKTTDRIEDHDKLWNSLHAALLVHAAHATVCELFACLEHQQNNRPTVTTYSYINMKEGK